MVWSNDSQLIGIIYLSGGIRLDDHRRSTMHRIFAGKIKRMGSWKPLFNVLLAVGLPFHCRIFLVILIQDSFLSYLFASCLGDEDACAFRTDTRRYSSREIRQRWPQKRGKRSTLQTSKEATVCEQLHVSKPYHHLKVVFAHLGLSTDKCYWRGLITEL